MYSFHHIKNVLRLQKEGAAAVTKQRNILEYDRYRWHVYLHVVGNKDITSVVDPGPQIGTHVIPGLTVRCNITVVVEDRPPPPPALLIVYRPIHNNRIYNASFIHSFIHSRVKHLWNIYVSIQSYPVMRTLILQQNNNTDTNAPLK